MNFDEYYDKQSGSGAFHGPLWQEGGSIRGFAGKEFQYGNGFGTFGRVLARFATPLLKYLGREGLKAGVNIGSDVLAGAPIKESLSNRIKETGKKVAGDAIQLAQRRITGKGRKIKGKGKKISGKRRKISGKGKMARRRRTNKRPVIRRRRTVRRKRTRRRRRVKKALTDIFA